MNRDGALGAPGNGARHADRARAGAAGPSLPRAALPDPHFDFRRADDFDEFRIHPLGKKRVVFEARSNLFEIERIDILEIEHAMRIAHGDAGHFVGLAVNNERAVFDLAVRVHRNFSSLEDRLAHIDFHQLADDAWPDDAGQGFDFEFAFVRDAVIVDVFGETADAVAAHLHLTAVGVVNLHLEVGDF